MQKRSEGSHQGQEKEIWNVFSTLKYSKISILRKNKGPLGFVFFCFCFCFFFKSFGDNLD